jgi:CheY-like chemotaxis protein
MVSTNILLVDNCKTDIENTKIAFSTIGIQSTLHFAESENEAWLLLQGKNKLSPTPKIMLIDINQSGSNGLDLLIKIRTYPELKSILIFVITGSDNDKNKAAALNLNVAGYLRKPIESGKWINFFSILNDYWNIIKFSN